MKSKTKTYATLLIAGAALMTNSSAFAEEEIVVPQIAICFPEGMDIADEVVTGDDVTTEVEISIDEEITDEEISNEDVEVVIDDKEIIDDELEVVTCWNLDWVKRGNDDDTNPEYYFMTTGGPALESTGGADQPATPQAADETSAVTIVEKNTVSANISRVANKPSAVKSNGRVFLR